MKERHAYTGERTYGLDMCPVEYDTLTIKVAVQQNFDMYPTLLRSQLHADDYMFLCPGKQMCDLAASDMALREVRQAMAAVSKGTIPKPTKSIEIIVNSWLAYLMMTKQVDRCKTYQWGYAKSVRYYAKKLAIPVHVRYADLSDMIPRQWTGNLTDWRLAEKKQPKVDLTILEEGAVLKTEFSKYKRERMKAVTA